MRVRESKRIQRPVTGDEITDMTAVNTAVPSCSVGLHALTDSGPSRNFARGQTPWPRKLLGTEEGTSGQLSAVLRADIGGESGYLALP